MNKSKLNIFTDKDFAKNDPEVISADKYLHNEYAAIIANEKLNKLIESWPLVYSNEGILTEYWGPTKHTFNTHKARLAFIEETKKEPCKHEPTEYVGQFGDTSRNWKCRLCGAKLVVEWKEA